ncbi:MAG: pentapeptide repeat-containing protein [Oscillospiraceae bacterium]|nr:pentapeptide repeat-containing protein [Oscillospiraceae bacterium]
MDANKLKEILEKHKKWLLQEDGGERADLRYADLRNADLRDTYLRYANMRDVDLRYANLRNAEIDGKQI